jgi:hypothetical protein
LFIKTGKIKKDKKEENKSGAELGIAPAHDTRPVAEIFLSCVRLFFSSQQLQWKIVGGGSDELLPGF